MFQPDLLYSDGGVPFEIGALTSSRTSPTIPAQRCTVRTRRSITRRIATRRSSQSVCWIWSAATSPISACSSGRPTPASATGFYNKRQDAQARRGDPGRHRQQDPTCCSTSRSAWTARWMTSACTSTSTARWTKVNGEGIYGTRSLGEVRRGTVQRHHRPLQGKMRWPGPQRTSASRPRTVMFMPL